MTTAFDPDRDERRRRRMRMRQFEMRRDRYAKRILVDGRWVVPWPHRPSPTYYTAWGCRCFGCTDENTRAMRRYREGRKEGK